MSKPEEKNKGGRPMARIDWEMVGEMLKAHCDSAGIAEALSIHHDTLYRRCKEDLGVSFTEFASAKKSEGKNLLRMKQFKMAMEGDRTLLIFLGKVLLGQKETSVNEIELSSPQFTGLEFFRALAGRNSEGTEDSQGDDS